MPGKLSTHRVLCGGTESLSKTLIHLQRAMSQSKGVINYGESVTRQLGKGERGQIEEGERRAKVNGKADGGSPSA